MTPSRPYLLRALLDWICDNGMTPHMLVDATSPGVSVPSRFVQDGRITLNIGPSAVEGLLMDNDGVRFSARFAGQPMQVEVPIRAVLAIFARENGQGMMFGQEPGGDFRGEHDSEASDGGDKPPPGDGGGRGAKRRKPGLKLVK